jgi:hypothetical protein
MPENNQIPSMYGTVGSNPGVNLLGMMSTVTGIQNALEQNKLIQANVDKARADTALAGDEAGHARASALLATTQAHGAQLENTIKGMNVAAYQKMGDIAKRNVGPDGQLNVPGFTLDLATDPVTAPFAAERMANLAQMGKVNAETVGITLDNNAKKNAHIADIASSVLGKAHDGQSYYETKPGGERVGIQDALDQGDLLNAIARLDPAHSIPDEDKLRFAVQAGVRNGKYDPRAGYQDILGFANSQAGKAKTLDTVFKDFQTKTGGVTQFGTVNPQTNVLHQGGTLEDQPTAPERNASITTQTPLGGEQIQPRSNFPMQTGGGNPAPGTGQMPGQMPVSPIPSKLSPVVAGPLGELPKYQQGLMEADTKATTSNQLIGEVEKALQHFTPGGFAEQRVKLAKALQGLGFSQSIVDDVANRSLPWSQVVQKMNPMLASSELKKALPAGSGPVLRGEFDLFKNNIGHIDQDPQAFREVLKFMKMQNEFAHDKVQAYVKLKDRAVTGKSMPEGLNSLGDFDTWFNDQAGKRAKYGSGGQ